MKNKKNWSKKGNIFLKVLDLIRPSLSFEMKETENSKNVLEIF